MNGRGRGSVRFLPGNGVRYFQDANVCGRVGLPVGVDFSVVSFSAGWVLRGWGYGAAGAGYGAGALYVRRGLCTALQIALMEGTAGKVYRIGEAAALVGVGPHTLRHWESVLRWRLHIRRRRGVRLYTARDVAVLRLVRHLTQRCGFKLRGLTRPKNDVCPVCGWSSE